VGGAVTRRSFYGPSTFYEFFEALNAVQVLEFDGAAVNYIQDLLSRSGMLPWLKVIRVMITGANCKRVLRILAAILKLRTEGGNRLTAIEPRTAESGVSWMIVSVSSGRSVSERKAYNVSWLNNLGGVLE
jgi:hypothetical protein